MITISDVQLGHQETLSTHIARDEIRFGSRDLSSEARRSFPRILPTSQIPCSSGKCRELKKEGIIRHYGISSIRPNVIREYAKRSNIVSVLMEYSLLNRRPEEWLPLLNEYQISIIARGPLAKGILTDNNARKIERVKEKDYLSYSYDELHTTLASVKETIGESSLTGTAIQYCLHNKTVAAVIPGASSLQQLQENIRASQQLPLTKEEYVQLQKIIKYDTYALHR